MKTIKYFLINGQVKNVFIDNNPIFSWITTNCEQQLSFRIIIKDKKTVFDSKEILSNQKQFCPTLCLQPSTKYYAKLVIKTDKGISSKTIRFYSALTKGFSNNAKWICAKESKITLGGASATYFYREFFVNELTKPAFLYISSLGLYNVFINDKNIDDNVLKEPFTNYTKKILYSAYEISKFLVHGKNTITVIVGDGWCNQNTLAAWNVFNVEWKDVNKTIIQMNIDNQEIVSNENFLTTIDGPITRSSIRLGESIDLRKELIFNENSVLANKPVGTLQLLHSNPIKEVKNMTYLKYHETNSGFVYDFGKNISGYVSFSLDEIEGKNIKIIYSERFDGKDISIAPNDMFIKDEEQQKIFQTDFLITKNGHNYYKPQFVYHGFRYVKIVGLNYQLDVSNLTVHFVRTNFKKIGQFACSNKTINKLNEISVNSFESNFVGFPSDCPTREKLGWTGDMQLSTEQSLYNFDIKEDLKKWIYDIIDCQLENGLIPCIAPTAKNIFGYDWGIGPAWDFAFYEIPYQIAQKYNDIDFIKDIIGNLEKHFKYLESREENDHLIHYGLGDWCYPKEMKDNVCPESFTSTLYYYQMALYLDYFCKMLKLDNRYYLNKAEYIKDSINKNFVTNNYDVANNSITALSGYLYFIKPEKKIKDIILNKLLKLIKEYKYSTMYGILGNKYLYRVLFDNGYGDLAIKIFNNKIYPSFGYMIENGATNLWENFEGSLSLNHHMFSDISAVFYNYIAGVSYKIKNGKPFIYVNIPQIKKIKWAKCKINTINGPCSVFWKKQQNLTNIKLILPFETTCILQYQNQTKTITQSDIVNKTIIINNTSTKQ